MLHADVFLPTQSPTHLVELQYIKVFLYLRRKIQNLTIPLQLISIFFSVGERQESTMDRSHTQTEQQLSLKSTWFSRYWSVGESWNTPRRHKQAQRERAKPRPYWLRDHCPNHGIITRLHKLSSGLFVLQDVSNERLIFIQVRASG